MELTMIRGDCPDGRTCPAVRRWADRGTLLVTGTLITDPALLSELPVGQGEAVVEVPDTLIPEVAAGDGNTWPAIHRADRGTLLVTGTLITDPALLSELPVGQGEAVVEVPDTLIPEVAANAR